MMRPAALVAIATAFALAACSPAPDPAAPASESISSPEGSEAALPIDTSPASGVQVSGTATWSGLDLAETARLIVEIRDTTRTPDPENFLLKQEFAITAGQPATFAVTVPETDLVPDGNLVLRARIQDGYAILFASDGDVDVADTGTTEGLEIPMFNPEDLARGKAGQMITPSGIAYTCGGEALTIAVEAGAAYVTFGDGNSAKLDKLETPAGNAAQFTNGKFVVEQGMDEYGAPVVRFGRGRAVPQLCTAAG